MPYKYPRASKHSLRVGKGNSGLGLFANSQIKKGDFIIEYIGPILRDAEADKKGGKYLFDLDKGLTIDGAGRDNRARYVNHSCKPNAEPELYGKRVFIYAKKNIKPNEEITYDYGKEYFNDFIKPYGCKCGHHRKKQ